MAGGSLHFNAPTTRRRRPDLSSAARGVKIRSIMFSQSRDFGQFAPDGPGFGGAEFRQERFALPLVRAEHRFDLHIAAYLRPEGWQPDPAAQGLLQVHWKNPAASEWLVLGSGALQESTLVAVGIAPAGLLVRAGAELIAPPLVIPVFFEDGVEALNVSFLLRVPPRLAPELPHGGLNFKNSYLMERDGRWFSIESICLGRSLDPSAHLARLHPALSSLRIRRA